MDKKTETTETYNRSAAGLASEFNAVGARVNDVEKAFSYFQKPNPRVLEIGCGNGRDAVEILKRTNNYLGIDISTELIKIAQDNVPHGHFKLADIEEFEFPQGLDIIFAFASLLHSPKDKVTKILAKAHEALNHKGIFYISLKLGDYHTETKTDQYGSRTYYFYTPEHITELAGENYKVIEKDFQQIRGQDWFTIVLQK